MARGRAKAARASRRRQPLTDGEDALGFLRRRRVSEVTRRRYEAAIAKFRLRSGTNDLSSIYVVDEALDMELVEMYLAGEELTVARYLMCALKWHLLVKPHDLPHSTASLQGYGRNSRESMRDPVTWEWTLLVALEAVRRARGCFSTHVEAAVVALLAFDTYARPSDWLVTQVAWLRPPAKGATAVLRAWTITFYPANQSLSNKAGLQDDTIAIGCSNPRRRWVSELAGLCALRRRGSQHLFTLSLREFENSLTILAEQAALPKRVPHQLRHGGASADAIDGLEDVPLQSRGRWASPKSVLRYRKPGRYLRELALLTPAQLRLARPAESTLLRDLRALLTQTHPSLSHSRKRPRRDT